MTKEPEQRLGCHQQTPLHKNSEEDQEALPYARGLVCEKVQGWLPTKALGSQIEPESWRERDSAKNSCDVLMLVFFLCFFFFFFQ